ncbi:MAG: hypothetical protein NC036_06935 [Muribaculaceae bacterium]|nr:hypothetical protein [Muribaculaceae bacterium]
MKKFLLLAAAGLMSLTASATQWFISGAFMGWSGHCKAEYELKETSAGVYSLTIEKATNDFSGEFLLCTGTVGNPNWSVRAGINGDKKIVADKPYNYAVNGSGNFKIEGIIAYPVTVTLDTNNQTLLLTGKAKENEYDTVYVVGDFNGGGWNDSKTTTPLTLKAGTQDVWEGDVAITSTKAYIKFRAGANLYGNGKEYGNDTNIVAGTEYTVYDYGQSYVLDAGTYHFEFTLAKNAPQGKLVVTNVGTVTFPETLYILGNVNGGDWNPSDPYAMVNEGDGIYTAEKVLIGESLGSGFGYFSFSEGKGANSTDWNVGIRYGATANDFVVTLNDEMTIVKGENAFKIASNKEYDFTVNLEDMTVVVEEVVAPAPTPVAPADMKIEPSVSDGALTYDEDMEMWDYTVSTEGTEVSLTLAIPEGWTNWVYQNYQTQNVEPLATRAFDEEAWMPVSTVETKGFKLGNVITTPTDGKMHMYGLYLVKDDQVYMNSPYMINVTATSDVNSGVEAIEAEGEATYFNLQGVKVVNPANGIFVKVVNGKASMVTVK